MRRLCYRKCYATNKEKFKKMGCEMLGKGIQLIKWKDNSGWFSKYAHESVQKAATKAVEGFKRVNAAMPGPSTVLGRLDLLGSKIQEKLYTGLWNDPDEWGGPCYAVCNTGGQDCDICQAKRDCARGDSYACDTERMLMRERLVRGGKRKQSPSSRRIRRQKLGGRRKKKTRKRYRSQRRTRRRTRRRRSRRQRGRKGRS